MDIAQRVRQVEALYFAGMDFNDALVEVRSWMDAEQAGLSYLEAKCR